MTLRIDTASSVARRGGWTATCVIGRSGACDAADKREGDGCTPRGTWPIRCVLLRPGRGYVIPAALPWRWLRPQDGWSDDVADAAYNRPVRHPHSHGAEHLWREDRVYDAIFVLGHNDAPPTAPLGSAIFLHLAGAGPTEGCVAIAPDAMMFLLANLQAGEPVHIL